MSTPIRSRVSVVGALSLLTVWSVAAQGVAQDSPEFGDEEVAPAEYESDVAADSPAPVAMQERDEAEQGYSSGAPDSAIYEEAATGQDENGEDLAPGLRFSAELGFFANSKDDTGSHLTLSPLLGLGLGLSNSLEFGVTWGLNYQSNGLPESAPMQSTESAFVIGNPHLWLTTHSKKGRTSFAFGGGIVLPAASLPEDATDAPIAASAYQHASAIRGDWNQWLWAPDRAAGVLHFASQGVLDELLIGGEAAVGLLAPMSDGGSMAAAGQMAAELGYATDCVSVVMRVQGVATVTPGLDDPFQVSLDPYVAWKVSDAATLMARWTINVDNPTGVDGAGIWGLRVGANLLL